METKDIMKHVWEAFSTLSDAQEIISSNPMGYRSVDAVETINHAKEHLNAIFEGMDNSLRVETMIEPCQLLTTT